MDYDGEAINSLEVIEEYKRPSTFKASANLATVE